MIRAQDMGVEVHVIHNASIMNAAGACGLQLYSFGATISIPYWTEEWRPMSFYEKLLYNKRGGMHTLCLLGTCACTHVCVCVCMDADVGDRETGDKRKAATIHLLQVSARSSCACTSRSRGH